MNAWIEVSPLMCRVCANISLGRHAKRHRMRSPDDATSKKLVDAITALRSIYNGTAIGGSFENGTIALIAREGLGYPPDKCEHQNDFTDRETLVTVCDDCGIVLEDLSLRDPAVELRRLQKRDLIATHHINRVTGHLKRLGAAIGKDPCDEGELVDAVLRRLSGEPGTAAHLVPGVMCPPLSSELDPSKLTSEELWRLADRMGAELVKRGELVRRTAATKPAVPNPDFCVHPDKCLGLSRCPRRISCCE